MRSMLVIGIGRFGKHLAMKLAELGNEVMVVDKQEACVNGLLDMVTTAQIGDCMDEAVLRSLGVGNFDVCFVCISSNFQSSLEITSLIHLSTIIKIYIAQRLIGVLTLGGSGKGIFTKFFCL